MKKTPLRRKSKTEVSVLKDKIQYLVREIVIKRDGGCIFRDVYSKFDLPPCNGYRKDGELVLQADHLETRSSSATYADTRLIVCACKGHHGWKSVGSNMRKDKYDQIVRQIISEERIKLWDKAIQDRFNSHRTSAYDWKMEIVALEQELSTYN